MMQYFGLFLAAFPTIYGCIHFRLFLAYEFLQSLLFVAAFPIFIAACQYLLLHSRLLIAAFPTYICCNLDS